MRDLIWLAILPLSFSPLFFFFPPSFLSPSFSHHNNSLSLQAYQRPNGYIASQGPIPSTFPDFWRMIWELDSPTIVMVTNLKEEDKVRTNIADSLVPPYPSSTPGTSAVLLIYISVFSRSVFCFQIKCHQYWPSYGTTTYGNIQVTLKEVENLAEYSIRTFNVSPVSWSPVC